MCSHCASVAAARASVRQCAGQPGLEDAQGAGGEHGGEVEIDCQFCNQRYLFDASDVAQLFAGGGTTTPSDTRH
jgi:hypothetical protein